MNGAARRFSFVAAGPELTPAQLRRLARLVHRTTGIVLDDSKHALASGRLAKRLRALGLPDYGEYLDRVEADLEGCELQELVNAITTNKTSFFREAHHFDILRKHIEARRAAALRGGPRLLRLWSAGCSTGEEPYSIAMTVAEALGAELPSWNVEIVATDVDTRVLRVAESATYGEDRTCGLPELARAYMEPVGGGGRRALRVVPRLRELVTFRQLNFVDDHWAVRGPFDHIFCRNVTIYFDRPTQARLYPRLAALLQLDGLFFAGHSENLSFCPEAFRLLSHTVYGRTDGRATIQAPADGGDAPGQRRASGTRPVVRSEPGLPARQALPPRPWPLSLPEIGIVAGDIFASREPTLVKTVLGSCISVCLHDPSAKMGGMNHFMLPSSPKNGAGSALFGIQAMEMLINALLKLGAERHRLVAKIAGAAHVVACGPPSGTVSDQNVAFIDEFLATEGFQVVGRKVGGTSGLELRFRTDTGEAFIRPLDARRTSSVAKQDEHYAQRIGRSQEKEDVTWFR